LLKDFLAHRPVFERHIYPVNQTIKLGEYAKFDCLYLSDVAAVAKFVKNITKDNFTVLNTAKVNFKLILLGIDLII
jgi:hypothetical protein